MGKSANPEQPSLSDLRPIIPLSRRRAKRAKVTEAVSASTAYGGQPEMKTKVLASLDHDFSFIKGTQLNLTQKLYLANESDRACFHTDFDDVAYLASYGLTKDLVKYLDHIERDRSLGIGSVKEFLSSIEVGAKMPSIYDSILEYRLYAIKGTATFISGRGSSEYTQVADQAIHCFKNRAQNVRMDWLEIRHTLDDLENKTTVPVRKQFAKDLKRVMKQIVYISNNPISRWTQTHEHILGSSFTYDRNMLTFGRESEMNWVLKLINTPK